VKINQRATQMCIIDRHIAALLSLPCTEFVLTLFEVASQRLSPVVPFAEPVAIRRGVPLDEWRRKALEQEGIGEGGI
jgi:hypothetical protein